MDIHLDYDEEIIKEGFANHFIGIEGVGGKLYLTNKRVYFNSHSKNIQVHDLSIPLAQIVSFGKRNTGWIIPNGIFIQTEDNTEKFAVWFRSSWIDALKKFID